MRWCAALAVLLVLAAAPGAVRTVRAQDIAVRASVGETTVGTEEAVTYTVEIEGATFADVETPRPPEAEGLILVQPMPSTQRNVTFINGQLRQSVAFSWAFRPSREGQARIGAAEITVKGKSYTTETIQVHVVPQAQRPRRQPRSAWPSPPAQTPPGAHAGEPEVDERDLFIKVIPSQRQAFQGEQVLLEYLLYFRDGVQLRHSRLAGSWDAEGFWREEFDIETRPIPRTVVENGLRYNVITLKRVAVFPARSGSLRVDPLQIETEAYVPHRSSDPFEQFFSLRNRFETVELASPAVTIEAVPLPDEAPPTFDGAVGSFRMDTRVSRAAVDVGEPVEVVISITGSGNLATLESPSLHPPGVFEAYDPQVNTNISRAGQEIRGTKTFTYVLVPRSNGTFELPPIAFTYFDPEARRYETLRSEPVSIRATGTATAPTTTTTTASGLPVDDIAGPLDSAGRWVATDRTPLYRQPWAYGALALPLLLLGGVAAVRRHVTRLATDTEYARGRMAHPVARRHLKQADALLQKGERMHAAFYAEIERAVLSFVGNRLNVAEQGLTRAQLDARLASLGIGAPTRDELRRLLDECDQVRFAPVTPDREAMQRARDRAARLIVAVDEAAARQPVSVD